MKDLSWIKDLVRAEQEMDEAGMVDITAGFNPDQALAAETIDFLTKLREAFVEYSTAFNQMRGLAVGGIKIYGISKTEADFMIFRNSFKLIFSSKGPGAISVKFQHQGVGFVPGTAIVDKTMDYLMNEETIEARWGAFNEIIWTHENLPIKLDYLVRHYLSLFIKESTK